LAVFNIESWLAHHGNKLQKRFQLSAYKMMNHLLKTIDITRGRDSFATVAATIEANIHIIGIDSDLFFTANENRATYEELKKHKKNISYQEIVSIHGHDAFLIEYQQLHNLLATIF
jgi:homoserine O-acetyltransferase